MNASWHVIAGALRGVVTCIPGLFDIFKAFAVVVVFGLGTTFPLKFYLQSNAD